MHVKLRMRFFGSQNWGAFRIVAANVRSRGLNGKFLEVVGAYNPISKSEKEKRNNMECAKLHVERIKYWLSVGAEPSETVAEVLRFAGLLPESWQEKTPNQKRKRKEANGESQP